MNKSRETHLREASRVLVHFALPKRNPDDSDEALIFAVHPETGDLVVQIACTPERLATYSYDRPPSFPVPPDAALLLAHEILRQFAPGVADFLERAVAAASLRVVEGGGGMPEAS